MPSSWWLPTSMNGPWAGTFSTSRKTGFVNRWAVSITPLTTPATREGGMLRSVVLIA